MAQFALKRDELESLVTITKQVSASSELAVANLIKELEVFTKTDECLKDCQMKDNIIEGVEPLIEALKKTQQYNEQVEALTAKAAEQWNLRIGEVNRKVSNISDVLKDVSTHLKERK